VIVFDHQEIGARSQNRAQSPRAAPRDCRAGGILRTRRDDDRARAAHRPDERIGQDAFVVDGNGNGDERLRGDEIENAGEARIFDEHAIAGAELLAQDALHSVERAADDRDVARRHAIGPELPPSNRHEIGIVERRVVEPLPDAKRAKMPLQVRQQSAIGISRREIADAAGRRGWGGRGGGGGADARAAPPRGDGDPALLQDAIRGGDRRAAHTESAGQRANGRQLLAGGDLPVADGRFDAPGDVDRGASADVLLS